MSTNDVIAWLLFYNTPFVRINGDGDEPITNLKIYLDKNNVEISFNYGGREIKLSEVSGYWYRRGGFPSLHKNINNLKDTFKSKKVLGDLTRFMQYEEKKLKEYLYKALEKTPFRVGSYATSDPCKLNMLEAALEVGLKIPQSLVTDTKKEVLHFKKNNGSIITKAIHNLLISEIYGKRYIFYTEEVTDQALSEIPSRIFPSIVQKKLNKLFELRIFYLNGTFYSMAIFSQSDDQTKVDFRNYNFEKPNRNVPFKLPSEIEVKLTALMKRLDLQTGSIDLVYTREKEFVFLEVNPVGQFGQVAGPCNYQLYRDIAKYISQKPVEPLLSNL